MSKNFENSAPGFPVHVEVRVVIFSLRENQLSILLAHLGSEDGAGGWELPGSSFLPGKSLDEIAHDCLQETIDLSEVYLEQLYTYGDPSPGHAQQTISIVYFSLISMDAFQEQKTSSRHVNWLPVDNLPNLISDHAEIIHYAVRRLRYKLEYSAVGFELLPETFSLSELQHTYEMILGEKLDKRNFRRRILEAGIIESTPHRRSGEGRPAQLFRYRPDAVAEVKARRLFP